MTLVVDLFKSLLPPRTKSSPSGWTSFNAPCCHHKGHKQDTRKRAGVRFDGDGIVYNCFNCKFSTGWQPGSPFGDKMKTLARWMNADDDTIKKFVFEAMKTESAEYKPQPSESKIEFTEKPLPEGALTLAEWNALMHGDIEKELGEDYVTVLEYLINRGYLNPLEYDFYWTPASGYRDRVIIPFRWQGKIVGNTARKVNKGKLKYLSDQHHHFVFNFDQQSDNQKYVLVQEGPFDALAVNGVALLTNEIADQQARIINSLGAEVIVIPDQDQAGLMLYDRAAELNWSVAVPNWDDDVKDTAEAVHKYGRLYVVVDAIMTAHKGSIKIAMAKQKLEQKLERLKYEENN
jgi:hypothetical protein